MNEWEAKYKALLSGIDNQEYVNNAELLVKKAIEISITSGMPFSKTFDAMLRVAGLLRPLPQIAHGSDLLKVWPTNE